VAVHILRILGPLLSMASSTCWGITAATHCCNDPPCHSHPCGWPTDEVLTWNQRPGRATMQDRAGVRSNTPTSVAP